MSRRLLELTAAFVVSPRADTAIPAVRITRPGGADITSNDGFADSELSQIIGRSVRLTAMRPGSVSVALKAPRRPLRMSKCPRAWRRSSRNCSLSPSSNFYSCASAAGSATLRSWGDKISLAKMLTLYRISSVTAQCAGEIAESCTMLRRSPAASACLEF